MGNMINASEAHRILVRQGSTMSYPTALKWFIKNGLAQQPTGKYGSMVIDEDALFVKLAEFEEEKENTCQSDPEAKQ